MTLETAKELEAPSLRSSHASHTLTFSASPDPNLLGTPKRTKYLYSVSCSVKSFSSPSS